MIDRMLNLFFGDVTPDEKKALTQLIFRGLLLMHIAWACGYLSVIGLHGFANAGEVKAVRDELTVKMEAQNNYIKSVQDSVIKSRNTAKRDAMEIEIRRLDQDIFSIEARVKELAAAGLRADRIYDERLSELRSMKAKVETRLEAFLRANPELTYME